VIYSGKYINENVWVESEPGKDSTFGFEIPVE
jgi:hypothetical protein